MTAMTRTTAAVSVGFSILMLAGCSYHSREMPQVGIGGIELEALERDEYEVMETVTGRAEIVWVLFFAFGDYAQSGHVNRLAPGYFAPAMRSPIYRATTYDALEELESGDVILPLSFSVEKRGFWPFFIRETGRMRAKALRIKSDREL